MNATRKPNSLVLRFGKALTNEPDLLERGEMNSGTPGMPPLWIALGHLDTLQVYPLPDSGKHWLSSVYENNVNQTRYSDGRFYFHPIHATISSSQEDFLALHYPYLFVTLLQGRDHVQRPDELKADVEARLNEWVAQPGEHTLEFRIYYSITLSDLVVLWKSDSIRSILDAIQWLYCASCVGDMHSIPTILSASIRGEAGAPPIRREELPLIINRYVVRDAERAYSFFKKFYAPEKTWFTIGIEDLTRVECGWTTENLCTILRRRMQDAAYRQSFRDAFLCCETHLGIPMQPVSDQVSQGETALTKYCGQLLMQYQEIVRRRGWTDELDIPWLKTAGDLFNALLDLSRNTVADGFCYLMLDAVSLFCDKLEKKSDKVFSSKGLEGIQRFLRGWESLLDKVMRTDGRFSQQPGFSPSLCDIPSSLLEFYLAFTARMGAVMQIDSVVKHRFAILLAPKLCRRIKVEKVFEDVPPCDRLLYVDIPITVLYQPFEVLCHLTHEISHFSGDTWRLRDLRAEKYLAVCAQELGAELLLVKKTTTDKIMEDLSNCKVKEQGYLDAMTKNVLKAVGTLLNNERIVTRWTDAEFQDLSPSQWGGRLQSGIQFQVLRTAIEQNPKKPEALFFDNMVDFHYLFKECYADEAAIFALQLKAAEYVLLNIRETQLFQRSYKKERVYYRAVERWAVVIHVCFPEQASELFAQPPEKMEDFVKDVEQCYCFHFTNEIFPDEKMEKLEKNYHRIESIHLLEEYLSACYRKMCEERRDNGQRTELERLQTAFRTLARDELDISAPSCSELVCRYRKDVLHI